MAKKSKQSRRARRLESVKQKHPVRKCTLIVCEGEKTEPGYFEFLAKELRLVNRTEIEVCGDGKDPLDVVDQALDLRQKRGKEAKRSNIDEYDSVWCVIDVDQHTRLSTAIDKAKGNNIHIAMSNPCFEYWYILHYENTASPFVNSRKVPSALRKFFRGYRKGMSKKVKERFFNEIHSRRPEAVKRAKQFAKNGKWTTNLKQHNPSTNVYKIVEWLVRIAASPPVKKTR